MDIKEYINTGKILVPTNCKTDENFDYENFSINDLCLVRTTDAFPLNHKIESPYDSKLIISDISGTPFYTSRKTVHFCLNGLVSSHDYGNFDDRAFVIIEPLKNQIQNIYCACPQDTWTTKSVNISNEALILVDERFKYKLQGVDLSGYNVIYFSGSMKNAVNNVLDSLGYKAQTISKHGYVEKNPKNKNAEFSQNFFSKKYPGILQVHHANTLYYSQEKKYDMLSIMLTKYHNKPTYVCDGYTFLKDEINYIIKEAKNNIGDMSLEEFQKIMRYHNIKYNVNSEKFTLESVQDYLKPRIEYEKRFGSYLEYDAKYIQNDIESYKIAYNKIILEQKKIMEEQKNKEKELEYQEKIDRFYEQNHDKKLNECSFLLSKFLRDYCKKFDNDITYSFVLSDKKVYLMCTKNADEEIVISTLKSLGIEYKDGYAQIDIDLSITLDEYIQAFSQWATNLNQTLNNIKKNVNKGIVSI